MEGSTTRAHGVSVDIGRHALMLVQCTVLSAANTPGLWQCLATSVLSVHLLPIHVFHRQTYMPV